MYFCANCIIMADIDNNDDNIIEENNLNFEHLDTEENLTTDDLIKSGEA